MSEVEIKLSKKLYILLVVFLACLVLFGILRIWQTYKQDPNNYPREISVEATGTASYTPDIAKVMIGVHTEGETSEIVVEENTRKMNKIMETLEGKGIEKEDIKTLNYYLDENWQWTEDRGSFQDGYILTQDLEVTFRDFEQIGDMISMVTTADIGANIVGGITFEIEDTNETKSIARQEAIAIAKEKAEEIAEASGFELGEVVGYYEYEDYYGDYYGKGGLGEMPVMEEMYDSASSIAPQIEPGQEELRLNVTLNYRIY